MKPSGAGSVMSDCARGPVAGDDALAALYRRLSYFACPPWAARAGAEIVLRHDPGAWWGWDPCCGEGCMTGPLWEYFPRVYATDIHDHGSIWQHGEPLDFLSPAADAVDQVDWIFMNPPFDEAAAFVGAALRRARRGVAVFNRANWFESGRRYPLFCGEAPVSFKATFFERVPLQLGGWNPEGSTATSYAWFVWLKPCAMPAWLQALRTAQPDAIPDFPIPPGTRERLTRDDDARRFAAPLRRAAA